ncbi:MAG: hypothetical protein KGL00_05155 [Gammaproteobacteria bacterium]|nr:hypothetical protein [Gammaproteobacteria bacterium]
MAVAGCAVLTVIAAPVYAAPWQWQIGLARGVPGGFIQVREHSVSGTALPLGPALGMDYVQRVRLAAVDNIGRGRAWVFKSDLARLYGETMLPTAAYFNGVELAEDKPLTTSASWLNNWQFTALYCQALVVKAAGARIDGEIGFTFVGLNYSLQGHPAGAANPSEASGSRTIEDFITQELPVPQLGLELSYPLPSSWCIDASVLGGHLPRVYSLRNEGGRVYVTQTDQEAQLGLIRRWRNGLELGFGWYDRYFMQHEQSAEDGNYIQMSEHGLYVDLRANF